MNVRELLKEAREILADCKIDGPSGLSTGTLEAISKTMARIDTYLAAPSGSAMEMAREAVDTIGRGMLAVGTEIDTSYGPMQPPEIQKDKAIPYLATLIEDYGRRVPRAMLEEISDMGDPCINDIRRERLDAIVAKYNVAIEEDPNDQA